MSTDVELSLSQTVTVPQAAFLGFAERAQQIRDSQTDVLKWNVLGLKNILLANFFPLMLSGLFMAFAFRPSALSVGLRILIKSEAGVEFGWVNVGLSSEASPVAPLTYSESMLLHQLPQSWVVAFIQLPTPAPVIERPGRHLVYVCADGGQETCIGEFQSVLVEPAPLTSERVAAIRSNPKAIKFVRAEYGCKLCSTKTRVYAGLERNAGLEAEGFSGTKRYRNASTAVAVAPISI